MNILIIYIMCACYLLILLINNINYIYYLFYKYNNNNNFMLCSVTNENRFYSLYFFKIIRLCKQKQKK